MSFVFLLSTLHVVPKNHRSVLVGQTPSSARDPPVALLRSSLEGRPSSYLGVIGSSVAWVSEARREVRHFVRKMFSAGGTPFQRANHDHVLLRTLEQAVNPSPCAAPMLPRCYRDCVRTSFHVESSPMKQLLPTATALGVLTGACVFAAGRKTVTRRALDSACAFTKP